MAKVHPNVAAPPPALEPLLAGQRREAAALTVWRKSLLFNCKGFTVFDADGDLAFRVDTYASESRGEVVLMDAAGHPVLTIRRKKLSLGDQWLIHAGDGAGRPLYAVKRHLHMRSGKAMARVVPCAAVGGAYDVEGSYARRCCAVYDERRHAVAEVQKKEGVGADVFRLVVQPEIGVSLAMAVVVALDQMFGTRPSLLRSWSS